MPREGHGFCGSCDACKYKTLDPYKDCRHGSICTRSNCKFAHASPCGRQDMAGTHPQGPKACNNGIRCRNKRCYFAHPSKALKCEASSSYSGDSGTGSSDDDESCYDSESEGLVDYMVDKLKNGSLSAGKLCSDIKKNFSWGDIIDSAGGFKSFCLEHDDKFNFVNDGGEGWVELVKSGWQKSRKDKKAKESVAGLRKQQEQQAQQFAELAQRQQQQMAALEQCYKQKVAELAQTREQQVREQCDGSAAGASTKTILGSELLDRMPVSAPMKEQSKDSSTVSVETTNFARYCRLLMDVGREVLMTLFKENYRKEEGVQWVESCGPSFLRAKFPDRFSQSKLGKHLIDSIYSGKCHEWDITLLSSLLIVTPGYVKGDAFGKKAVEALRKQRNDLAHEAQLLAHLSLTKEQFQIKWEIVSASLKDLIKLLPGDEAVWRIKIDSIAKEEMGKSAIELLFERVKEDMKRILDDLVDVRDKAGEAFRMAEGAARMSQVVALDAKIQKLEKLESLLNKQGHVDHDRLPRDVALSNQKRYRLLKQVGKGGMGTVFEAKLIAADSDDGKLALKICNADASGRAEREATILKKLSNLNHDNIVKFFDSAFKDSHLVIIMELIKGQSLDEWLEHRYSDGNSGVTFNETQPIVKQLVQGMSAVHAIDIAHLDLKPANLVFDEATGKLVIVDFGLSKQHNTNATVTAANCQVGTLLYMSPEQIKGDLKEISFSSDVWAIGVVWHEMLTSFTPFEPASTPAHADRTAASKRQSFSKREEKERMEVEEKGVPKLPLLDERKVPSQIIGIIAKCLFFEKNNRYGDAQELLHQIECAFQELEEADRKLREELEPLRQEEERARAEAAAREEEQRREEERLRQEEEERLEAEGKVQEAERKRQEEEAERRRMEEESADSVMPSKLRCASDTVEPGWACSSSTCNTS